MPASILAAISATRVEVAVAVDRLQHHRIAGRDAVELVERKAARVVGELLLRPAAEHHDPFAGLRLAHPLGEHLERPRPRGDAVEAQFVVLGGAHPMGVVVDQARNDGAAGEIDHARRGALERLDLGRGPDLDDALTADGERLRDGEAVVDRDDLAVHQDEVGRLRVRGGGYADQQRQSDRDGVEQSHFYPPGEAFSFDAAISRSSLDSDHRRRLTTFSGTISPLNVNSCGSEGSTVTRTQCVSGQPKVSTRVKFSNSRLVFLL